MTSILNQLSPGISPHKNITPVATPATIVFIDEDNLIIFICDINIIAPVKHFIGHY